MTYPKDRPMIDELLEELQVKVNTYLNQLNGGPVSQTIVVDDISRHEKHTEGVDQDLENRIVITLANIEEETILKNNYPVRQEGATFVNEKSALYLNICLLFSAHFTNYSEGLKQLSRVIQFFQFNRSITFFFTEPCEVRFNLHNIGFENLNNLWTVMGGRYLPSVIFKARILHFQASPPISGPAIVDIQESETMN